LEIHHVNMKATTTKDAQDTIAQREPENVSLKHGRLQAALKPGSWPVIVTNLDRQCSARALSTSVEVLSGKTTMSRHERK
jgi:hypothetical protein